MSARVVLRTFGTRGEAASARALLAGNGIDAFVLGDDCGALDPALSFGRGVQLLVDEDDAARADEVLHGELPKEDAEALEQAALLARPPVFDRYTPPALQALFGARELASRDGSGTIATRHLLAAILAERDRATRKFLARSGVATEDLERACAPPVPSSGAGDRRREIPFDEAVKRAVAHAGEEAGDSIEAPIRPAHLLLALLLVEEEGGGGPLTQHGASVERFRAALDR